LEVSEGRTVSVKTRKASNGWWEKKKLSIHFGRLN